VSKKKIYIVIRKKNEVIIKTSSYYEGSKVVIFGNVFGIVQG